MTEGAGVSPALSAGRLTASVRAADSGQAARGPMVVPLRMQSVIMGWLSNTLIPGGLEAALGRDVSLGAGGLPGDPGNRAPGGNCPPAGFCTGVPPSSHSSRPFGLAVFFTSDGPSLALPAFEIPALAVVLELTPVSLIERPG